MQTTEPEIDEIGNAQPGQVMTGIEDVDIDGGAAVLLDKLKGKGKDAGKVYVMMYDPETDELRQLNVPDNFKFMGHDGGEATGYSPTVYDPMRLDSPETHPIRVLPNSYLPKNPNYPSSITDTVWRPTVRMTPIRFYNTQKAGGFERGHEYEEDTPAWPAKENINFPTSDTVNPPSKTKTRMRGKDLFDPKAQTPTMQIDLDEEMEGAAKAFWSEYQQTRLRGGAETLNLDILDFADIFAAQHELALADMPKLMNYMVQIGLMNEYMLDKYSVRQLGRLTGLDTRTHFHTRP